MENITIGQIIAGITSIGVIIGFIKLVYEIVKKTTLDKISNNAMEINQLKADVSILKNEVKDSKEERFVIVNGLLACLKGLQELKCDGPVTEGIKQIEEYLMKKSHD